MKIHESNVGVALLLALFVPTSGAQTITEIIDLTGDGAGSPLFAARAIAVDGSGNAYVTGDGSDNVFEVTPGGFITQIIDATGDGAGNALDFPLTSRWTGQRMSTWQVASATTRSRSHRAG